MLKGEMLFLRHSFRQGNQVAHVLSGDALKMSNSTIVHRFVIPPPYILCHLSSDLSSTSLAAKKLDAHVCVFSQYG
ncbi:hypothetical protein RND71_032640 [Anisodus tanguticus]|uniref:Uncharacterized protein n=1 Tax=Anisodus tanguticus TaxID=243964 RepID=A0AAE1V0N2_9SOLA|nr:hypothetical protein RND71_032640 [Anisodus tanguticus]